MSTTPDIAPTPAPESGTEPSESTAPLAPLRDAAPARRASRFAAGLIDLFVTVSIAGSVKLVQLFTEFALFRANAAFFRAFPHVVAAGLASVAFLAWRRNRPVAAGVAFVGGALLSLGALAVDLLEFSGKSEPLAQAAVALGLLYLLLGQIAGLVARGQTLGAYVLGIALVRTDGSPAGILRTGFVRPIVLAAAAAAGALALGLERLDGVAYASFALWGAIALNAVSSLFGDRSLRDRLAGTRLVVRDGEELRAYVPPRFSGVGFVWAVGGLVLTGGLAGLVYKGIAISGFGSTDFDLPLVGVLVAVPLGLVATGAVASFAARRFVLGELVLTALFTGVLAIDLFSTGLVPVPAMQRFDLAGPLDWSVYAVGTYFGLVVFFIIGSAVGFMVDRDRAFGPRRLGEWVLTGSASIVWLFAKLGLSREFEWQVARRHLRLSWRHWVQLAVISTLLPILLYGIAIWPVRTVWRLVHGRAVEKPLPPTVFMALLTVVGIMFGVTSLNVVLAVMGGFERDLKEKILGTNAHGVIHRYVGDFEEWRDVQQKARAVPGVQGTTPFILSEGMIVAGENVTGAVVKGIDPETVGSVTDLEKYIDVDDGSLQNLQYPNRIPQKDKPKGDALDGEEKPAEDEGALPGIVVGREMARSLHVWIGDRVTVMNPLGDVGPTGYVPRGRPFRVAAVFVSGMYEYDSKFAYIQLREAQRFYRLGDSVSGIELRFANVDEARPLMRSIGRILGGFPYRTKDWGEMNANLFSALRLERVVMFILLSFQVLIACICVIATLVMLVVEKRKEVATLKAMGAREGSIMKLFVFEGLVIGAIGVFYGSAAGYLFCRLIEKFGVGLDPEVYYITRLPVVIEPSAFLAVGLVAMVLVFVATIYPARRGGSIAPVEGFREE